MANRVEIHRISDLEGDKEQIDRDIYSGLTREPKDLSLWPKYFYDARGSELFEEITRQPEYYQTPTELSILQSLLNKSFSGGEFHELVELGSGSASKTKALLDSMVSANGWLRYVPLDVSESAVRESAHRLLSAYPSLYVSGHVGDFDGAVEGFLRSLPEIEGSRLVIFLGGTIGNFSASQREDFLKGIRRGLSQGDRFLLGIDLVKSVPMMEAAYDDEAGVTAAFNKNFLEVINRRLGADFDTDLFLHRSVFDSENSRIEMWLISCIDQKIRISNLDLDVCFAAGEGLRTEVSHKFTRGSIEAMFEGSGLHLLDLYTDEEELFGLALGEPE